MKALASEAQLLVQAGSVGRGRFGCVVLDILLAFRLLCPGISTSVLGYWFPMFPSSQ